MSVKFLHTRIRVSDLEKSINWYCETCGFTVHKRSDKSPAGNQIVHLAYSDCANESTGCRNHKVALPFLAIRFAPGEEINAWHISRSSSMRVRRRSGALWHLCARPVISPLMIFSFVRADHQLQSVRQLCSR